MVHRLFTISGNHFTETGIMKYSKSLFDYGYNKIYNIHFFLSSSTLTVVITLHFDRIMYTNLADRLNFSCAENIEIGNNQKIWGKKQANKQTNDFREYTLHFINVPLENSKFQMCVYKIA